LPRPKEEALDPEQAEELEALFSKHACLEMAKEAALRMRELLQAWAQAADASKRRELRHALRGVAMSYGARRVAELVREPLDAARIEEEIEAFWQACRARWEDAGDASAGGA